LVVATLSKLLKTVLLTLIYEVFQGIDVILAAFQPGVIVGPTLNHEDLFEGGQDSRIVQTLGMWGWHNFIVGTTNKEHGYLNPWDSFDGCPFHSQ
jgi:hypothetical protein